MTKTISLADDAYEALVAVRRPGESFSEIARRLARMAALEDVFDPSFRLAGDGAEWKARTRQARDADKRARSEIG